MKLFLYEYASAQSDSAAAPAAIRREGRAMLDALREDARRLGAEPLTLSPQPDASEERRLCQEMAAAADACILVAPECGELQMRTALAARRGARVLGCLSPALEYVSDKLWLARRWREAGVPAPLTWRPREQPLAPLPWVRKWRRGAGSQEMKLLWLPEPSRDGPDWILQEYIPGTAASVAFLCGPDGFRVPLLPAIQRLTEDDAFRYLGGRLPAPVPLRQRALDLAERALAAVDRPGLQGYVGVDVVMGDAADGSGDRAIEINPRLTTSYLGLRRMTDANLLELWLKVVDGERPAPPAWRERTIVFDANGAWREE